MELSSFTFIVLLGIFIVLFIPIFTITPVGVAFISFLPLKNLNYFQKYAIHTVNFFKYNLFLHIISLLPFLGFPLTHFLIQLVITILFFSTYYFVFYSKSLLKIEEDNLWEYLSLYSSNK